MHEVSVVLQDIELESVQANGYCEAQDFIVFPIKGRFDYFRSEEGHILLSGQGVPLESVTDAMALIEENKSPDCDMIAVNPYKTLPKGGYTLISQLKDFEETDWEPRKVKFLTYINGKKQEWICLMSKNKNRPACLLVTEIFGHYYGIKASYAKIIEEAVHDVATFADDFEGFAGLALIL